MSEKDMCYKGSPRLELKTRFAGEEAVLVAYVAGDPGAYDEFSVDLVTKDGAMQVVTAGVDVAAGEVHGYGYLANAQDVASAVSYSASTGKVTASATVAAEGAPGEADAADVFWAPSVTPETLHDGSEDVDAFVQTVQMALVATGGGRYDRLQEPGRGFSVRHVGSQAFVGLGDSYMNVTGDSLPVVAIAMMQLVRGERQCSRAELDAMAERLARAGAERKEQAAPLPRRHGATMAVTLQRWVRDYAVPVDEVRFDCSAALDALYPIDRLPADADELHSEGWNYGEDVFCEAAALGLCDRWDGPFEAYLRDDYQQYLGERLAAELGSAEAVLAWLQARLSRRGDALDLSQEPEGSWPAWASASMSAAKGALASMAP